MPYARPTLQQLFASALQDVQAGALPGVDPLLSKAVLRVLTRALSGLAYEHYGYQDYIAEQSVPWTATGEDLVGWAALKGVTRKAATTSIFQASFVGNPGRSLPSGTALSTPNNLGFTTSIDAIAASSGIVLTTMISNGSGTSFNLAVGAVINLVNPITGINSAGVVTALVQTAADLELESDFKTRMLQEYASPPQGGDQQDYVEWAEAVPGVTRAWCNPNGAGPGTVVVYTMFDLAEAGFGGFPQGTNGVAAAEPRATSAAGDQLTVANALFPLRPVTALVYSVAPIAGPVAFTIANLVPNNPTILVAINAAVTDMLLRVGTPLGMTLFQNEITEAINSVAAITQYTLIAPAAPLVIPLGTLPTLGVLTATS